MNPKMMSRLRIGIGVLAVIGIGVNILIFGRPHSEPLEVMVPRPVKEDTNDKPIVINHFESPPDVTKKQMQDVFRYANIYKQLNGCYPQSETVLP